MKNVKRNWGLVMALAVVLAVPVAAQQLGRSTLKDEMNRRPDDVTLDRQLTPEEEALAHYQQGVALVQGAIQQEQKANEAQPPKREKLLKKVDKAFESAAREFETATEMNPSLLQAWGGLGWVHRKLARWDDAVAAYDAVLAIEPNFTAAVEGRAEACLALSRIDEVRDAYAHLEQADQKNAAQLLGAVEQWVQQQRAAGQADADAVREMMAFVVEKRDAS